MNKIILNLDLREGLFTLNKGTIEALGRPRQVQILINIAERMLVLRACGTEGAHDTGRAGNEPGSCL